MTARRRRTKKEAREHGEFVLATIVMVAIAVLMVADAVLR